MVNKENKNGQNVIDLNKDRKNILENRNNIDWEEVKVLTLLGMEYFEGKLDEGEEVIMQIETGYGNLDLIVGNHNGELYVGKVI